MGTLQGELLTRIARAHQRAMTAEYALQEAKEALKRTREARDLEEAKAAKKAAELELAGALAETAQLPLPALAQSSALGSLEYRASGVERAGDMARVVTA